MARRPLHAFGMGADNPHGLRSGMALIDMVSRVAAQPSRGGKGRLVRPRQQAQGEQWRGQQQEAQIKKEPEPQSEVGVNEPSSRTWPTSSQATPRPMGRSRNEFISTEASLSVRGCNNWVTNSVHGINFGGRGVKARADGSRRITAINDSAKLSTVDEGGVGGGHMGTPQPQRHQRAVRAAQTTWGDPGSDARTCEPKTALTMNEVLCRAKSRDWVRATASKFMVKFHATSTWLSKQSKRKKVAQLMEVCGSQGPPVTEENLTQVSVLLDQTSVQSADQYVAELKLWHIEMGHPWSEALERRLVLCKGSQEEHRP